MERIGTEKVDTATVLYPFTDLNGKRIFKPMDDILVELWTDEFEVERLEKQMINRKRIRNGQAPLYDLPTKSSHELALAKLNQKKQAEEREFDKYLRKQESNYIEFMIDKCMQEGDVTLEDMLLIYERIKANLPIENIGQVKTTATDALEEKLVKQNIEQRKEKKKKTKKNYFKKIALAASVVLGLLLPSKNANRLESNVSKNTTIESQKKQDEKVNIQPKEVENNQKNKIIINSKTVRSVLKKEIRLKDNIILKNATFHYSSTGVGPKVSQDNVSCDNYKITKVAILSSDNEVIDTIAVNKENKNTSIDELKTNIKSVYGNDVKIKINVTGIEKGEDAYKNIGWTSISKVSGNSKVYSKKR